jgi:hypothetical protein
MSTPSPFFVLPFYFFYCTTFFANTNNWSDLARTVGVCVVDFLSILSPLVTAMIYRESENAPLGEERDVQHDYDGSDESDTSSFTRGDDGGRQGVPMDHDDFGVEIVLNETSDSQRTNNVTMNESNRTTSLYKCDKNFVSGVSRNNVGSIARNSTNNHRQGDSSISGSSSKSSRRQLQEGNDAARRLSQHNLKSYQRPHHPRTMFVRPRQTIAKNLPPLFDDQSEASSAATSNNRHQESFRQDDNPFRAAKRGDLAALKQFHREGTVDWAAKDQYGNIPLFYACHR